MIFTPTGLPGAFVIDLEPIADSRGWFARAWCAKELAEHGLEAGVEQLNTSYSAVAGTLRGLHYQAEPHSEAKLARCISGAVFDVIVDARPDSPAHLKWFGVELSAANRRAIYAPKGFAHGFLSLEDNTEMLYFSSTPYAPGSERGIRWNDPAVGIRWPREVSVISEKDGSWPALVPFSLAPDGGRGLGEGDE